MQLADEFFDQGECAFPTCSSPVGLTLDGEADERTIWHESIAWSANGKVSIVCDERHETLLGEQPNAVSLGEY